MNDQNTPQPQTDAGQAIPKVATTKTIGKYKVEIIRDKCISAASCVAIAGNTFELDEEQIASFVSKKNDQGEEVHDAEEKILLGAQSCPTAAIVITDTETNEQVWPKA